MWYIELTLYDDMDDYYEYDGEYPEAGTFDTREAALEWCREHSTMYEIYSIAKGE